MTDYVYANNQVRFGSRDGFPANATEKRVSGAQLDLEFDAVALASASKLNAASPSFTGTMTGGGIIDGGTY